jgi:hypothetical protein
MRTATTREEFENALQAKNMDVVLRTNDAGRIYGVTFIDHENKVVLNGSRLGNAFSANVFHAWFNENITPHQQTASQQQMQSQQSSPPRQPSSGRTNVPVQTPGNDQRNTPTEPAKSSDSSSIEELFGIFDMKPQGENYDEATFARRMRKKKRKKSI